MRNEKMGPTEKVKNDEITKKEKMCSINHIDECT